MRKSIHAVVCGLFAVSALGGQTVHNVQVCDITGADCFQYDSSRIGGLRFEDYRVTNPQVIQFDPTMRLKELAATGASNTSAMCNTPPTFAGTPPSITFDKTSVVGQVYWVPVGPSDGNPFEFMDVQFKNFAA